MDNTSQENGAQRLEKALIGFLLLQALGAVVIYVLDPSVYLAKLSLEPSSANPYPLPATLSVAAVLLVILAVIYGVVHRWRWLFWLLVLVLGGNALGLLVGTLRQFAGVTPNSSPLWFSLYSLALSLILAGFAIWMVLVYRRAGAWGMGRR